MASATSVNWLGDSARISNIHNPTLLIDSSRSCDQKSTSPEKGLSQTRSRRPLITDLMSQIQINLCHKYSRCRFEILSRREWVIFQSSVWSIYGLRLNGRQWHNATQCTTAVQYRTVRLYSTIVTAVQYNCYFADSPKTPNIQSSCPQFWAPGGGGGGDLALRLNGIFCFSFQLISFRLIT